MLMILGFFSALVAGAAADTMLSARANPDQDDDTDAHETASSPDSGDGDFLAFFDPPPTADLPPPDIPALHDGLAERIHSSDAFPSPPGPEPVIAVADDNMAALNGAGLNDWLTGGGAASYLAGHGGNDLLQAGTGPTHQIGGEGDDILLGGMGNDRLEGGEGDDLLIAGAGSNTLMGGAGNDILVGHNFGASDTDASDPNFLNGGDGDDLLIAGNGDYLNGGAGNDIFALGDWLHGGAVVSIMDYHADEDQILLQYDPVRVINPDIEIRFDSDAVDTAQIWLNGQLIAQVAQAPGLTVADIGLVPLSGPSIAA